MVSRTICFAYLCIMNEKKPSVIFFVIGVIVVVVGVLIWFQQKSASQDQLRVQEELARLEEERGVLEKKAEELQDEGMQGKEEAQEAKEDAGTSPQAPRCLSDIILTPPLDTKGWYEHRNYVSGFQLTRPDGFKIERNPALESQGIEVFRIFSSQFEEGAELKAYDLRTRRFAVGDVGGKQVSYELLPNKWYQKVIVGEGSMFQECAPYEAAKTTGQWPVFVVEKGAGDIFSRVYVVIHPSLDVQKDRFPIALEFSLQTDKNVMNANQKTAFDEFVKEFETFIQSVRFFVPQ